MRRQAVTRKDLWMVGSPSRCQASLNPCGSWGCAPGPAAAAFFVCLITRRYIKRCKHQPHWPKPVGRRDEETGRQEDRGTNGLGGGGTERQGDRGGEGREEGDEWESREKETRKGQGEGEGERRTARNRQ